MKKLKEDSTTFRVLKALRDADDFLTVQQCMELSGRAYNRVQAALHHMWKHHAVDFVVSGETTYWFARSAADDTRSKTVDERVMESKPRKQRKRKEKQS